MDDRLFVIRATTNFALLLSAVAATIDEYAFIAARAGISRLKSKRTSEQLSILQQEILICCRRQRHTTTAVTGTIDKLG